MSKFFKKPFDISYEYMESYVNSYSDKNDLTLFKYIYLLSKKYAIDTRMNFKNSDMLDLFSIRCASKIYDIILDKDNNLNFRDIFNKIRIVVIEELDLDVHNDNVDQINIFRNYLISKVFEYTNNSYLDISDFSSYVASYMKKVPKKKISSEWYNLYKSVLLSLYKTISTYDDKLFDFDTVIHPIVELYNCDKKYTCYIEAIVLQLLYSLKDNFNKTISSKRENIFTLHFKEVLNGTKC